jgi:hypothetical protein
MYAYIHTCVHTLIRTHTQTYTYNTHRPIPDVMLAGTCLLLSSKLFDPKDTALRAKHVIEYIHETHPQVHVTLNKVTQLKTYTLSKLKGSIFVCCMLYVVRMFCCMFVCMYVCMYVCMHVCMYE